MQNLPCHVRGHQGPGAKEFELDLVAADLIFEIANSQVVARDRIFRAG